MKKLLAILLVLVMVLSLVACGKTETNTPSTDTNTPGTSTDTRTPRRCAAAMAFKKAGSGEK